MIKYNSAKFYYLDLKTDSKIFLVLPEYHKLPYQIKDIIFLYYNFVY